MPRAARAVIVDSPLHVVQRGINRGDCFFRESDYLTYLDYLRKFSERFDCSVHAYCLMTNHVHLLLTPHAETACGQLETNPVRAGMTASAGEHRFEPTPDFAPKYYQKTSSTKSARRFRSAALSERPVENVADL